MQKSGDDETIRRNGLTAWVIEIATGEYRRVDGPVTVVDTLPDGLCPLGGSNFTSGNQPSDARARYRRRPNRPLSHTPVQPGGERRRHVDDHLGARRTDLHHQRHVPDHLPQPRPARATSRASGVSATPGARQRQLDQQASRSPPSTPSTTCPWQACPPAPNPASDDSSASQAAPNPGDPERRRRAADRRHAGLQHRQLDRRRRRRCPPPPTTDPATASATGCSSCSTTPACRCPLAPSCSTATSSGPTSCRPASCSSSSGVRTRRRARPPATPSSTSTRSPSRTPRPAS